MVDLFMRRSLFSEMLKIKQYVVLCKSFLRHGVFKRVVQFVLYVVLAVFEGFE